MVRRQRGIRVGRILLVALAVFISSQVGESQAKNRAVPFKAFGTAVWDNLFAGFDPEVGASFVGSGNGTHLGRFSQTGNLFFSGPPDEFGNIPGFGSVVLTAANGDELHFDYVGVLESATGIGSGTLIFTGGTGRFADAVGSGEFYAEIDGFVEAPMKVWLTGRLKY